MPDKEPRTYECNICREAITVPHPWASNMSAHKRTCRNKRKVKKDEQLNNLAETGRKAKETKKQTKEIIYTKIQEIITRTRNIIEEFEMIPRPLEFVVPNPFHFVEMNDKDGYEQEILEDLAPVDIPVYVPEPKVKPSVIPTQGEAIPQNPPSVNVTQVEVQPSINPTQGGQMEALELLVDSFNLEENQKTTFLTLLQKIIQPSVNVTQVPIPSFDFGTGEKIDLVKNLTKFDTIREAFLSAEKFDALKDLYDLFTLSYTQTMGGYGLTEHKKEVLVTIMMKIRKTFEFLKGPHRENKKYQMLARYSETTLYNKLHGLILASSMDTLSQRETDKVEVAKILAEATISSDEDKEELRDIMKSFTKTEDT